MHARARSRASGVSELRLLQPLRCCLLRAVSGCVKASELLMARPLVVRVERTLAGGSVRRAEGRCGARAVWLPDAEKELLPPLALLGSSSTVRCRTRDERCVALPPAENESPAGSVALAGEKEEEEEEAKFTPALLPLFERDVPVAWCVWKRS